MRNPNSSFRWHRSPEQSYELNTFCSLSSFVTLKNPQDVFWWGRNSKCLTVERLTVEWAHAVGGRRLLQGLLGHLSPLGLVLQSFLEFPLGLLLLLQTLLDDRWRERKDHGFEKWGLGCRLEDRLLLTGIWLLQIIITSLKNKKYHSDI